jgi:hypothetical protein
VVGKWLWTARDEGFGWPLALTEEHHVMRQNCQCGGDQQCPGCGGKQWLSRADPQRVAGQVQGAA